MRDFTVDFLRDTDPAICQVATLHCLRKPSQKLKKKSPRFPPDILLLKRRPPLLLFGFGLAAVIKLAKDGSTTSILWRGCGWLIFRQNYCRGNVFMFYFHNLWYSGRRACIIRPHTTLFSFQLSIKFAIIHLVHRCNLFIQFCFVPYDWSNPLWFHVLSIDRNLILFLSIHGSGFNYRLINLSPS